MATITPQELKTLSKYIYSIAGIFLDESKGYLVQSRLNPLLVAFSLASFSELYYKAKTDASGELEKHIIDAISTNETFFFRDNTPFDLLKFKIIPELIDTKKNRNQRGKIPISIWSAACSTGQEVYSIAISLVEVLPNINEYEITILGSDISQQAITQASYGQYNKLEVGRGLSPEYLQKYFQPTSAGWRIKDFIRSMASFQVMNLMHPFGSIGPFDIVFCRNVAIYFSYPDKRKLFTRISRVLRPGGYLLVGGSESLAGLAPQFESRHYLRGMYYQLKAKHQTKQAEEPNQPAASASFPQRGGAGPNDRVQTEKTQKPAPVQTKTGGRTMDRQKSNSPASGPHKSSPGGKPPAPMPNAKRQTSGTGGKKEPPRKPSLLGNLQSQDKRPGDNNPRATKASHNTSGSLLSKLRTKKKSSS